jgi:hypothetical protein
MFRFFIGEKVFRRAFLIILLPFALFGEDENKRVSDSTIVKSLAESQRAIFISLQGVGADQSAVSIPVYDCTNSCEKSKVWTIPLPRDILDDAKNSLENRVIKSRFDLVEQKGNELLLEVGDLEFSETAPLQEKIAGEDISLDIYQRVVDNYINREDFLTPLKNILKESIPKRLSRRVPNISTELSERILDKSYVIVSYLRDIRGEFHLVGSRKDSGYKLALKLDISLQTILYKYSSELDRFQLFASLSGDSFEISETDSLGHLYGINYFDSKYQKVPSQVDGTALFKEHIGNSFQNGLEDTLHKIIHLEQLKIRQPIEKRVGKKIFFQSGEKFPIDTPINFQNSNGEQIGWGKIYGKERNSSTYRATVLEDGDIKKYDFLTSAEWSGYLWGIGMEQYTSEFLYGGSKVATGTGTAIFGEVKGDLGYLLNEYYLSEVWVNFLLYRGDESVSSDGAVSRITDVKFEYLYGYQVGAEYRYYPYSTIYLTGGVDLGGKISKYKINFENRGLSGDGYVQTISHYLQPKFGIGYSFSKDIELFLQAGFDLSLFSSSSLTNGSGRELDIDYLDGTQFEVEGTSHISFGVLFNW